MKITSANISAKLINPFSPIHTEMPTSEDLKSGDPVSNYPTPPQGKGDETSSPSNQPPCPQTNLELRMFILTLQQEKKEEDFEVF